MPAVDRLGLVCGQCAPRITLGVPDDKFPARPDAAVQPEAVRGHADFRNRPLPGQHVGVDGIDQRPVQVEKQGTHVRSLFAGWTR